jgi:serine O-acetyltransferase
MDNDMLNDMLNDIKFSDLVDELAAERLHISLSTNGKDLQPMPDLSELGKAVQIMFKILFPGFYSGSVINEGNLKYYIGVYLNQLSGILKEQIYRGFGLEIMKESDPDLLKIKANESVGLFLEKMPEIKRLLFADIQATFSGDPAAKNTGEIIFCYPGIRALTHHRIAHELLKLGVPLIPRIISEMAHSSTGIDIHPGATIGEALAIDHGTGVVIGETCRIGNNVKIYQGVTLGALSFPVDSQGNPIKGIDRHPIIEDGVVIYAGATILGRITVGKNSTIGGNVWLTHDVPPNSKILQRKAKEEVFLDGAGI